MNIAILGSAWGDEGKGHITHHLSKDYDWIIRFNGGANAGHTIYRDGVKYVHNLMPSFDWRSPKPKAFLGSGMVIDLPQLHLEINKLFAIDPSLPSRVYVDPDAFVVLEQHKDEDKKLNGHIGSTNRGIGPAYKSKIERKGIRIRDFLNGHQLDNAVDNWSKLAFDKLKELGVHFKGVLEIQSEMKNADLLFEGAQGVLLDINHGIYPYVSCSDCTIGGIYSSGFHFAPPSKVYGVAKCYTTKVGEGPFPTELKGEEAESLRKMGNEYGATTGRPRRVGWLDLPALNYACQVSGITNLIITKFDILNGMDTVPLCMSYDKNPTCSDDFFKAKPNYMDVLGWDDPKSVTELTPFISEVEFATKCPVSYISTGTDNKDILEWRQ
jgi:adenylosuccinate synthase